MSEYEELKDEQARKEKAERITKRFIGIHSKSPINISGESAEEILANFNLGKFPVDLFEKSRQQIYQLLKADAFPRFVVFRKK